MHYRLLPNGNVQVTTGLLFWTEKGIWNQAKPMLTDGVMLHNGSLLTLAPGSGPRLYATLTSPDDIPDLTNTRWDAVAQLRDGNLLRLDRGRLFRGDSAYTKQWTQVNVPADLVIADIATLTDGSVLCLTDKGRFWSGTPDLANWALRQDMPGCGLARVEALADGSLLGVSWDKQPDEPGDLYYLPPDMMAWQLIGSSYKLSNVIALPGGALLGVTPAKKPGDQPGVPDRKPIISYTSPAPWRPVSKPPTGAVALTRGLAIDELLALGNDGNLYAGKQAPNGDVKWAPSTLPVPGFKVISIAGSPWTGEIFAVGSDTKIYRYTAEKNAWTPAPNRIGLNSVTIVDTVGTFVAAGPPLPDQTSKRYLYFRGNWSELPAGPAVVALGTAHDGSILEVRPDGTVHRRPTRDEAPVPCGITGTSQVIHAGDLVDDSPARWLLHHTSNDYQSVTGNGRPWGDGTAMAARAQLGEAPWDEGNRITPFIGGGETLASIRDCFEAAIADAEISAAPPGQRGHVYIADWLLNGLRDLSENNPWGVGSWKGQTLNVAKDQTALGLIGRLMAAGIKVRVMVWMPTSTQDFVTAAQSRQHASLAAAIEELNTTLCGKPGWADANPIGVCALDLRTAPSVSSSLHQKMIVIRVGSINVAFCGGVDLAFTRRDARRPLNAMAGEGDWQSGSTSPIAADGWPTAAKPAGGKPVTFPIAGEKEQFPEDLAENVYGQPRHWHDQHLKLEGPIVGALEEQFDERWRLPANVSVYDPSISMLKFWEKYRGDGGVLFSNAKASPSGKAVTIPSLGPVSEPPACGEAIVQMWRTIPVGANRGGALFTRGEYTIMAGVANAVAKAEKLITIWDQYFWSEPLARLLAHRVSTVPGLRLVVVLPAHGSTKPPAEMGYRKRALNTLWEGLGGKAARDRVLVLNSWNHARNVGIYVHAKVQTYDDCLLVCGSANMNRRSFTNDMELDVAVLHRPTVRWHLARLAHMVLGRPWTDFGEGWVDKLFAAVQGAAKTVITPGCSLIPDPFFGSAQGTRTPNGIDYSPDSTFLTESGFEPSSLSFSIESTKPGEVGYQAGGDATGRLDLMTHLIENHTKGNTFPYRK